MKYKKRLLALSLWIYPFGVLTVIGLMLSKRTKIALLTCILTAYLFAVTFIPTDSRVEVMADDWRYDYAGGIGVNDIEFNSEEGLAADPDSTTSVISPYIPDETVSSEYIESSDSTTDDGNQNFVSKTSKHKTSKTRTTKVKTTKVKTTKSKPVKTTAKTTIKPTSVVTDVPEKPIIYLSDESIVYTNQSYTYMHTDAKCKKLTGTIVRIPFKKCFRLCIPYCPECSDTVLYVPKEDEIITDYE